MPLPLTVSCFNKIQIGFAFLVLAHLGSPGKGPLNGCVCVCVCISQVIDCEDRLRNDLYCVEWGVKLYSNQPTKLVSNMTLPAVLLWSWYWAPATVDQYHLLVRRSAANIPCHTPLLWSNDEPDRVVSTQQLLLHQFDRLFSRTTWVSQYRKEMMGFWEGSGISWTICKLSAPRSRQITTPTPHHSIFTGRVLFVTPNRVRALKAN